MSDEEYNQIFYSYSDNTMGKLIEKVSNLFRFDEKIREKLWDIHQKRNFYAYHYFKDRSTKWYTIEGRFEMIQEIDLVDMKTKELEENLVILAEPLVKSLGLTDEIIEKEFKKLKEGKLISDNLTSKKKIPNKCFNPITLFVTLLASRFAPLCKKRANPSLRSGASVKG